MGLLHETFAPWRPGAPHRAVAVLMSGGVDSSVAALLLRDAGCEIVGVTLRIPQAQRARSARPCCGWEAANLCRQLGIPHFFADTDRLFEDLVIAPFRADYRAGRTPSPCVDCNTRLKFTAVRHAVRDELGIRAIATGHYARLLPGADGQTGLFPAAEAARDQSYFLYGLRPEELPHTRFPLGSLTKAEVRRIAARHGLSSADRPDSMELCFAGEGDYRRALALPDAEAAQTGRADATGETGPILDESGRELGRHHGLWNFTPGQRRGLRIAARQPLYVLRLDRPRNAVIAGPRERAFAPTATAGQFHLLAPAHLYPGATLRGKIRSAGAGTPCTVGTLDAERITVRFAHPVFAPAAGQHLVLYAANGQVAGGGVLEEPAPTTFAPEPDAPCRAPCPRP